MLTRGRLTTAIFILFFAFPLATVAADELVAEVRAARDSFRPLDQNDLKAVRAELDEAVAALEARFARAGDTAEGWQDYLRWSQIKEQLAEPAGPDLQFLEKLFARLSAGHEGLGLTVFADLRDGTRRYVGVARGVEGGANLEARFKSVLEALAKTLESYAKSPAGKEAAMISAYLRWLADARQVPGLVQDIRAEYLNRNFYAAVSEGLVESTIGRQVDDTAPVYDCILGTSIRGTGHTTGEVTVDLVPSEDRATIVTEMNGTNLADTIGYNGPVIIYSDGSTALTVRKRILIDGHGLSTLPARADAVTESHIHSIRARNGMRIIERFAWRRALRQKSEADAIASQHAEWKAQSRYDEEIGSQIAPANHDFQAKVREPLLARGLYPAELDFSTDENSLNVSMLQAGEFDLGSATNPPEVVPEADLRVCIHESMINNFASSALSRMIFREKRVQEAIIDALGELPEELESEEGAEPWGIKFQSARPVWVAFGDDEFTVSIRGSRFYEGETQHPGMDVTVTYRIVSEGESVKAVRQGDVQIFPPGFDPEGDKQLSAQQTAIRRILQRRLGRLFEREIVPQGLVLPEESSRAGTLRLVQWEARNGWLVLSWKQTRDPAEDAAGTSDVAAVR